MVCISHERQSKQTLMLAVSDLGELQTAILDRSANAVRRLIGRGLDPSGDKDDVITPLACAITWPEGIQLLLKAGANPFSGLSMAAKLRDYATFEMILGSDVALFPGFQSTMREDFGMNDPGHMTESICQFVDVGLDLLIAHSLRDRRAALKRMAILHLDEHESSALGLRDGQVLDKHAFEVYCALSRKGLQMTPYLWPGRQSTVYHMRWLRGLLAEKLYGAGFRDIDEPDSANLRPILRECMTGGSSLDMVPFYAEKGASLSFDKPYWPSTLFYQAWDARSVVTFRKIWKNDAFHQGIALVSSKVDNVATDDCDCYCSSRGCTPLHLLLKHVHRSDASFERADWTKPRRLEWWLDTCKPDQDSTGQLRREAARLEAFELLGMAHTCCSLESGEVIPTLPMDEEVGILRDEDSELNQQLELIMNAYDFHRPNFKGPGSEFDSLWRTRIVSILSIAEGHDVDGDHWIRPFVVTGTTNMTSTTLNFLEFLRKELFSNFSVDTALSRRISGEMNHEEHRPAPEMQDNP